MKFNRLIPELTVSNIEKTRNSMLICWGFK